MQQGTASVLTAGLTSALDVLLTCQLAKADPGGYRIMATNTSRARLPAGYRVEWRVKRKAPLPATTGVHPLKAPMPAGALVAVGFIAPFSGPPISCSAIAKY